MVRTAVDLFSGIGGFSRAAEANGIEVVCHVEIDKDCQEYLRRRWPEVPVYRDIKTFPSERYAGADLVMGGPPCQPISCTGKRKGAEDDRWLWDETLKVVEIVRPRWCLFENPPGIRNLGLDGILSHLEGLDYTVGTVDIPACAVNAPHIRQRYWIIAHLADATSKRERPGQSRSDNSGRELQAGTEQGRNRCDDGQGHMADSRSNGKRSRRAESERQLWKTEAPDALLHLANHKRQGLEEPAGQPEDAGQERKAAQRGAVCDVGNAERTNGGGRREQSGCSSWSCSGDNRSMPWSHYHWTPCADGKVRRTPDAALLLADGAAVDVVDALAEEGWPKRSVLKALGNSIVWMVAAKVIAAMVEVEARWS